MARKAPRTTPRTAAQKIADKYVAPKGGKKAEKPEPEDFELSAASVAKAKAPVTIVIERPAPTPSITAKEALFIEFYAGECAFNGAEAARRAGYPAKSARERAYELLTKPHIKSAIEVARKELLAKVGIDNASYLLELIALLREDKLELFTPTGALKPMEQWPLRFRTTLVKGMKIEELYAGEGEARVNFGRVTEIKFSDPLTVLRMIGQHTSIGAFDRRAKPNGDEESALSKLMAEISGRGIRPRIAAKPSAPASNALRPRG